MSISSIQGFLSFIITSMNTGDLLVDARGPEILHRSGITAPDDFIYLYPDGGTPTVFFDAREYDVQKQKIQQLGNGVHVERLEPFLKKTFFETLLNILSKFQISTVRVSSSLPYGIARALSEAGITLDIYSYQTERDRKTDREIAHMIDAQRVNESALDLAWKILLESSITDNQVLYQGEVLTSEYMKSEIRIHLLKQGYDCPDGIIVASGAQTARPHDEGEGPILPHECIIVDIFPRSEKTGFFADMTRTFVKGGPTEEIKKLFQAVESVQKEIADSITLGEKCSEVHARTITAFQKLRHATSPEAGFMHGTGHSLGLAVHEGPRFNSTCDVVLEPGMVLTVEPGLYYPELGGVRIEDVVVFHPDGRKENITQFNKPSFIV